MAFDPYGYEDDWLTSQALPMNGPSPIQAPFAPTDTGAAAWNALTPDAQQAAVVPVPQTAAAPAGTAGGYSGAKDLASLVRYWQGSHPASAPDMPGLIAFLNAQGISASTALHNGMASDDKITINGQIYDLGSSLGSPTGSWFSDFGPMGAGGDTAGSLSGLLDPYSGVFKPPDPNAAFSAVKGRLPGLPQIDPFKAPDYAAMLADQGYMGREKRGADALQHGAAARGVLRTGGSLKALLEYGQNFASNEYDKVFGRSLDTYKTNVGNTLDLYDRNLNQSLIGEQGANTAYDQGWERYKQDWQMFNNDQRTRLDLLTGQAGRGLTAAGG